MKPVIKVAHDIICPWCWIAYEQTKILQPEFDVEFDWVGHELFPPDMEWPDPTPPAEYNSKRAPVPTRLELAYAASGLTPPPPNIRPKGMRSHNVLLALEWAKSEGVFSALNAKLYEGYWLEGQNVNDLETLKSLSAQLGLNTAALVRSVEAEEHADKIVPFDEPSYEAGVYNVPTYYVGALKLAEQPLPVLRSAIDQWLKQSHF